MLWARKGSLLVTGEGPELRSSLPHCICLSGLKALSSGLNNSSEPTGVSTATELKLGEAGRSRVVACPMSSGF